ncbi:hypothetical protein TSUD_41600 [Trifolium subterraneum]|nr:hypothetical protein TSUD_41600 [Trifolium subterraneum]
MMQTIQNNHQEMQQMVEAIQNSQQQMEETIGNNHQAMQRMVEAIQNDQQQMVETIGNKHQTMVTAINKSRDHVIASINEYVAGRFTTMTIKMDVILAKVSALDKMIMRSATSRGNEERHKKFN